MCLPVSLDEYLTLSQLHNKTSEMETGIARRDRQWGLGEGIAWVGKGRVARLRKGEALTLLLHCYVSFVARSEVR